MKKSKSENPVKRSVWQTDEGHFFSTGNGVHACEEIPDKGLFSGSGFFQGFLNLQNCGLPVPPGFSRISGCPETRAVRRQI